MQKRSTPFNLAQQRTGNTMSLHRAALQIEWVYTPSNLKRFW
ncbi:hypothetical protein PALB_35690 [Pseudoalteromonas luteoviolacea B = ATCC 29581]|nr:hypothetical protein PALB_35690 [Pseudoalteromonas luteoviolacea B = ATCC 29581]